MLTSYKLKIKRPGQWFYRTLVLKGQTFLEPKDKLVLEKSDGTYYELPEVSKCEFKYGKDLIQFQDALRKKAKENDNVSRAQG